VEQLEHQGNQLRRAGDTVKDIQDESRRANKILNTIRWSLFREKVCLATSMVVLLSVDVLLLVFFFGCRDAGRS
jgi:hypothetical protein